MLLIAFVISGIISYIILVPLKLSGKEIEKTTNIRFIKPTFTGFILFKRNKTWLTINSQKKNI